MTGRKIEVKGPEKDRRPETEPAAEQPTPPETGAAEMNATLKGNGEAKGETPAEAPAVEPTARELTDHLQRLAAEFENYKKRTAREAQNMKEIGLARALEAVLPTLDSFALSLATPSTGQDAALWREGLEKIGRQLFESLQKLGLAIVSPEPGEPLNPHLHEVVFTQPSAEVPPDCVLQVFQPGYRVNDRLLRPAKVVVAAAPAPAPATEEQGNKS